MNKKRSLIKDESAVSPVIAMVLMLAVVVSIMAGIQTRHVPVWNQEIEYKHVNDVYDEMRMLGADITNVFNYQVPKECVLHLGVRYPSRAGFYNPTDALIGTLSVNPEYNITINYTKFDGSSGSETFPSCSLAYNAYGTTPHAKIVYEHGIVIRDYGVYGNATAGKQLLIGEDGNVNVPILNGTDMILTSKGVETLTIEPYSGKEPVIGIHYVNVTLTTNYPEVWKTILENANTSGTNATVIGNKIHINSTKKDSIQFISDLTNWQSDRLYSGIVAISPDPGVGLTGTGEGTATGGTIWKNIPSSDEDPKILVTNIVYDEADVKDLNNDYIIIFVSDYYGNWWKAEIEFEKKKIEGEDEPCIKEIIVESGTTDVNSEFKQDILDSINPFNTSTTIDLGNRSNYDVPDACYYNASVGDSNTLVTQLIDKEKPHKRSLEYFYLTIE